MAKHSGGNFNNNSGGFFNNIFDLNFDGKVDGMDFFLMRQIMDNIKKEDELDDGWRIYADEGDKYGINPYVYDSRDEYLDAVIYAASNIENNVGDTDGSDADTDDECALSENITIPVKLEINFQKDENVKEDDYPNHRSFEAARMLQFYADYPEEADEDDKKRCEFVLNNSCIAARYMTHDGFFLFAQAIRENFTFR